MKKFNVFKGILKLPILNKSNLNKSNLILIKIFSYSCMNCLRSLNYIKKIHLKYKGKLSIILVHPYEFQFERKLPNIRNFVKKNNIRFPVVIDKDRKLTGKLGINFWPTQILIKNNKIEYMNIGENNYKGLESAIIRASNTRNRRLFKKEPKLSRIPPIYCGKNKKAMIKHDSLKKVFGTIYTNSRWDQKNECIKSISKKESSISILTKGKEVNMVAHSTDIKHIKVNIKIDEKFLKKIKIREAKMYNIIRKVRNKPHLLELTTDSNKLAVYSFTFN